MGKSRRQPSISRFITRLETLRLEVVGAAARAANMDLEVVAEHLHNAKVQILKADRAAREAEARQHKDPSHD